ncbi:hypothetical protein ACOSQ2_022582 [Xanthoceras sorbifolium]
MVEVKEEDSRIGPGLRSSVGLVVEAKRGCLVGKGASLVESSVALGSIIGVQIVDVNNGNKKDIGSGLINRVAMEGVKVDEGDVLACATSEVGQIDAQMVKLNDSKDKNVKKWKRAAWAWSKSQILGKASSPLQRMLVASQKINKSPRRKNGSLGKQLPVSKGRQRSSPKISAGEQDNGNSQSMEIVGICGKRKGSFISLEELQEAKKKR